MYALVPLSRCRSPWLIKFIALPIRTLPKIYDEKKTTGFLAAKTITQEIVMFVFFILSLLNV
jgi:hypothetical protein